MKIAVFCEREHDAGLELLGQARRMAPEACLLALHEQPEGEKYLRSGADEALYLEPAEDDCAQGCRIVRALKALEPDIVLFPATVRGRFLSAWAAARLQTGLTADCTGLSITREGLLLQTRPAYGSHLTADILCREKRPQMASVRPGVFPVPEERPPGRDARARTLSLPAEKAFLQLTRFLPAEGDVSLQSAPVIVAGGKGVGGREGFSLLSELASLLGGAVGASRSAVDAGWISYSHQIGQTGVTVRPALYIAFGISGMIQHAVGMRAAGTVIAVNTDRNAPIFRCADIGVVADWRETAEYMLQFIQNHLKERKVAP